MKNIVIMGSSGHLAFKKIYPALNHINQPVGVILYCNRNSEEKLKQKILSDKSIFSNIEKRIKIVPGDYTDLRGLIPYMKNSVFYLALPPFLYYPVIKEILRYGGNTLAIEKPFGEDTSDFNNIKELLSVNQTVKCFFIDHFITKFLPIEAINLLQTRPYSTILNNKFINSCQIVIKENIAAEGRKYFDKTGTINDMLVNHLLQFFTVFSGVQHRINDLLEHTSLLNEYSLFGQYAGYKDEMENMETNTETFALVVASVNTERWEGVPFLMYSGKAMDVKDYKVIYKFKNEALKELSEIIKFEHRNDSKDIKLVFEIIEERIYFDFGSYELEIFNKSYVKYKHDFYDYEGIFYSLLNRIETFPFVNPAEIPHSWSIFHEVINAPKKPIVYPKGYNFDKEIREIEEKLWNKKVKI
ncbi:Glucose-6-phosphate 1-dehydrogenase [Cucumispora dikerogammari]|nr:Glucose-6-phosphate 1-dehydrogenase [Cucumispora dikerogammari]